MKRSKRPARRFKASHPPKVKCEYCHKRLARDASTVDHRVPLSRGGPNNESNMAISCEVCNKDKGPLTAEEFIPARKDRPLLKTLIREVSKELHDKALQRSSP